MAGNPRKFSEKIAIQQRKLNEEKSEFETIMSEVSRITRGDPVVEAPNLCPPGGWPRPGGSLPNVCHLAQQPQMMPPVDQMAMYAGQWPGPSGGVGGGGGMDNVRMTMVHPRERSPGASAHGHHSHTYHPYRPVSPHAISPRNVSPSRGLSPEIGQQAPPQFPGPHHMYLVPPQDTSWRRTHSDPGIHASVMHPTMPGVQQSAHSPSANTPPGNASASNSPVGDMAQSVGSAACYLDPKGNMSASHMRPRSCENVPHLPNINIQPSEPVAGPQIAISNSTGSLPDLPSSLLPAHMQAQKVDDVIGSQPPPSYSQSAYASSGQSNSAAPVSNALQQRHSIQLPVQYSQGVMVGGQKYVYGGAGQQNFVSHQSYPPESPRSTSGSPNEGISLGHQSETPASSPQMAQPQSPGSPYCSLQAQMQNINIVDPQSQTTYASQQQGYYSSGTSGSCYGSVPASSTSYQQYSAMTAPHMQITTQQQQQMYQAFVMQQQQHQHQQQQHYHQQVGVGMQQHQAMHMQPSSPQGSQIPNIIFTGTDGSIHAGAANRNINGDGLYVDAAVELLSSDLRMSLDPVDLETLHGLANEQGLHIDAASEDELRHDRM